MSDSSAFCSGCGARLGSTDRFCPTCGAAVSRETEAPVDNGAPEIVRKVANKTGEEVLDRAVSAGVGGVMGFLGPIIASLLPSLLLTLTAGGRGFLGWVALTWPLTLAAAAIVVVQQRSTRDSLSIVPIAIVILLVATVLGVNLAGTPINLSAMPTGAIAVLIFLVQGLLGAFGPGAFALSVIAGVLTGVMVLRLSNVAANSVGKTPN